MALQTNRVKCPRCGHINPGGHKKCETCDTPLVVVNVKPTGDGQASAQDQMKQIFFRRGQIVAGRYTVMDMIGRGGMGCIYKVYDNTLKEEVALKTLLPQFARDKLVVDRFYNEARIARALSHEGIVRVHDIGLDGDILYISMEFLKGKSLRALMDAQPPGTLLPITQVLRIFESLCAALDYAHQFTVHRDIKPENVMIGNEGAVKLMDFGISKLVTHTSMTATSVVMGTPHYMSPEQLKDSANVDGRADVYSVGVMLYEVTTGNIPTGVPKPASQLQSEVPHKIDEIISKCLEPDPARRYQSASELRKELRSTYDMITGMAEKLDTSLDALKPKGAKANAEGAGRGLRVVAGVAGIAIILGVALWGFSTVEARWKAAEEAVVIPTPSNPGGTTAPQPNELSWEAIQRIVEKSRAASSRDRVANREAIIAAGDANWTAAQEAWDGGAQDIARAFARDAMQCFAAPRMLSEYSDMVFVWPGDVVLRDGSSETTVHVSGFLIDSREVTVAEFLDFCEKVPGGWTAPTSIRNNNSEYPATDVTFYDALACASFMGKTLPTEAQWARAAYGEPLEEGFNDTFPWSDTYEPGNANVSDRNNPSLMPVGNFEADRSRTFDLYDVVGNASEWTASIFVPVSRISTDDRAPDMSTPLFDAAMVVRGGDAFQDPQPLRARASFPYAARYPALGFRCVIPLPMDIAQLDTLINQ